MWTRTPSKTPSKAPSITPSQGSSAPSRASLKARSSHTPSRAPSHAPSKTSRTSEPGNQVVLFEKRPPSTAARSKVSTSSNARSGLIEAPTYVASSSGPSTVGQSVFRAPTSLASSSGTSVFPRSRFEDSQASTNQSHGDGTTHYAVEQVDIVQVEINGRWVTESVQIGATTALRPSEVPAETRQQLNRDLNQQSSSSGFVMDPGSASAFDTATQALSRLQLQPASSGSGKSRASRSSVTHQRSSTPATRQGESASAGTPSDVGTWVSDQSNRSKKTSKVSGGRSMVSGITDRSVDPKDSVSRISAGSGRSNGTAATPQPQPDLANRYHPRR